MDVSEVFASGEIGVYTFKIPVNESVYGYYVFTVAKFVIITMTCVFTQVLYIIGVCSASPMFAGFASVHFAPYKEVVE